MHWAVIDVQAFTGPSRSEFIVKEFTLVDIDTLEETSYIFKPPQELPREDGRSLNDIWLEKHFHSLAWDQGDHDYSYLEVVLKRIASKYSFLFAKGHEKCDFLEKAARHPVYELQKFGCPGLKQLTKNAKCTRCPNHKRQEAVCSHLQAKVLAEWAHHNKDLINLLDERVRVNTFSTWASVQDPARLSRCGFVHVRGTHTGVRCVYCNYEVAKVPYRDDIQTDHLEIRPHCPTFSKGIQN